MNKFSNKDLLKRTDHVQIDIEILKRRWGWLGGRPHLEKAKHQHYEKGVDVEPSGQEKDGDDNNTWRRDLEADITQTGLSWQQPERIAQDRRRWREVVHGFKRSQEPK